jgi:sulfoxide reductase heme-binding subunit YedZ
MSGPAPLEYGWWLASRASGLVALVCVTVSVIVGLSMAGRAFRRPGVNRVLLAVHEQASLAGLVAIAVHGITLLGDAWLKPGIVGIAVPFAGEYRPLWTGLGILGGWLAAALGLSFYARRRIGVKVWRKLHRAAIVAYVLSVAHTVGAGTDAGAGWMRAGVLATSLTVLFLLLVRVLPRRLDAPAPDAAVVPSFGPPSASCGEPSSRGTPAPTRAA